MIYFRYMLKEGVKSTLLIFFSLFFLLMVTDLSVHIKSFIRIGFSLKLTFIYVAAQLSNQGELLIALSLLITTIYQLTRSSIRGEVTALLSAGISPRSLTYPLLTLTCSMLVLLYGNALFLQPAANRFLTRFEERFFKGASEKNEVFSIGLEDGSRLIYQTYDRDERCFHDLFWIQDFDHILHMETLDPFERYGLDVTFLERDAKGFSLISKEERVDFPQMTFQGFSLEQANKPPAWQSPISLWKQRPHRFFGLRDDEAKMLTAFFQKLTSPLLALFAFLAPAPFCLLLTRHRPLFSLYSLALGAFLLYITLVNATTILSKANVISPYIAMLLFPVISLFFFGARYAKL